MIILDDIKTVFDLAISITTFLGIGGLVFMSNKISNKLIEQKPEIVFGFYSKIKVYLLELRHKLGDSYKSPLSENSYEQEREKLGNFAIEFLSFLKTQDWQVPLNSNVQTNFDELTIFLLEISHLANKEESEYASKIALAKLTEIRQIIDEIINDIDIEQKNIITNYTNIQKSI